MRVNRQGPVLLPIVQTSTNEKYMSLGIYTFPNEGKLFRPDSHPGIRRLRCPRTYFQVLRMNPSPASYRPAVNARLSIMVSVEG